MDESTPQPIPEQAVAEALWKRILTALRTRNLLGKGRLTERAVALVAQTALGSDLVKQFVEDYFEPIQYGGDAGHIALDEAECLVAEVERLLAASPPAPASSPTMGTSGEINGPASLPDIVEAPELEEALPVGDPASLRLHEQEAARKRAQEKTEQRDREREEKRVAAEAERLARDKAREIAWQEKIDQKERIAEAKRQKKAQEYADRMAKAKAKQKEIDDAKAQAKANEDLARERRAQIKADKAKQAITKTEKGEKGRGLSAVQSLVALIVFIFKTLAFTLFRMIVFLLGIAIIAVNLEPLFDAARQMPVIEMESSILGMLFIYICATTFSFMFILYSLPEPLKNLVWDNIPKSAQPMLPIYIIGVLALLGAALCFYVRGTLESEGYRFPGISGHVLNEIGLDALDQAFQDTGSTAHLRITGIVSKVQLDGEDERQIEALYANGDDVCYVLVSMPTPTEAGLLRRLVIFYKVNSGEWKPLSR